MSSAYDVKCALRGWSRKVEALDVYEGAEGSERRAVGVLAGLSVVSWVSRFCMPDSLPPIGWIRIINVCI